MIRHTLALALLVFPAGSLAQETIPGRTPVIDKLLTGVIEQYRSARTYRDEFVSDLVLEGEGTDRLGTRAPQTQKLIFHAPNMLKLDAAEFSIVCDGKTLWEQVNPVEQYIERAAPQQIDLDKVALAQFEAFQEGRHPIAVVLTDHKADLLKAIGEITEFTGLVMETRSGEEGARLSGTANLSQGGPSVSAEFVVWFDSEGLLREITYDLTKRYQAVLELQGAAEQGIKLTKALQRKRFNNPILNGPVRPELFNYQVGPYFRKVAEFEPVTQDEMQKRLIGRPAPGFTVMDLHGKQVRLDDFKGKVVMLDFWATSCGPCIMSFPQIEELSGKYKKQPVAILGVNGDSLPPTTAPAAATRPAVRFEPIARFLQAKKVTYPQLMDVDSTISEAYRVSGIPCVVLLDKKGVIQAIHMGYRPDAAEMYGADIDRLLKGESLVRRPTATQAAGG